MAAQWWHQGRYPCQLYVAVEVRCGRQGHTGGPHWYGTVQPLGDGARRP
jgi:hypothetical protein